MTPETTNSLLTTNEETFATKTKRGVFGCDGFLKCEEVLNGEDLKHDIFNLLQYVSFIVDAKKPNHDLMMKDLSLFMLSKYGNPSARN